MINNFLTRQLALSIFFFTASLFAEPAEKLEKENPDLPPLTHPYPSYSDSDYSATEIDDLVKEVRESRPTMHRGGWEWDRLLTRYIDGGRKEKNELEILKAYFLSILDRYTERKAKEPKDPLTLFFNHRSWGSGGRMRIYEELVNQKAITQEEQNLFEKMVVDSLELDFPDYSQIEVGANNRPFGINGGPALAWRLFRNHENSKRHKKWLDAQWHELTIYGDTTETNYYPYGPLYLTGLIDMAEGMGKFKTDGDFLKQHFKRYLYYIHGGGVRGNPNSGSDVNPVPREQIYRDPWNAGYYNGEASALDADVWYKVAKEYKDPEFLWASVQVCLGGRPPKNYDWDPDDKKAYLDAYDRRYAWFKGKGIEPKAPKGGAAISRYSELDKKKPERLFLCSSRESGKPFASFYIFDRNNNYMHYCDDSDGKLYEYCADGAKFLHTSGKYTSGRAGVGEGAYDMLTVLPPDMKFPMTADDGMDEPTGEEWKMASISIKTILPSRSGPDTENWKFDEQIQKYRRIGNMTLVKEGERPLGYAHGNMDGYWGIDNSFHLTSVELGDFPDGARIQNLRLAGPGGEKTLMAGDSIPEELAVELVQDDQRVQLHGELRKAVLEVVPDDGSNRREGKALQVINLDPNSRLSLKLSGLDQKFDGIKEYTRISYDFLGKSDGRIVPNETMKPYYFTPRWHRGAILDTGSLEAVTKNEDSFGQFTMSNYYGAKSRWIRQAVLTEEGYLIVRDSYTPCSDVDGYQAAPCWSIKAEDDSAFGNNWFDAPARDHAWWQKRKKRVLLYLHQGEGLEVGQVEHRTSADIRGGDVKNSFAKATLKAGTKQVWLSVLRPFDEGEDAEKLAGEISTKIGTDGSATAKIGEIEVKISAKGNWSVDRK